MSLVVTTALIFYALGMALVFGGTAALSFAAAPQIFRNLPPYDAGKVFGKTLRVFDAMSSYASLVAVVAGVAGMAVKFSAAGVARVVLAASVYTVVTLLRKSVAPQMAALKPPETADEERTWDPEKRKAFDVLHKQYVRLYSANLFSSLAALVLCALPA